MVMLTPENGAIVAGHHRISSADLHNHFRTSSWVRDSDLENAAIHATHSSRMGYGAVVALVNFEDTRYEETIDAARKSKNVKIHQLGGNAVYLPSINECLIVKGQELPTPQGHMLFLGLDRDTYIQRGVPFQERSLADALSEAQKLGAIAIIDHPFYKDGLFYSPSAGIKRCLSRGDMEKIIGYEIHNGAAQFGFPGVTPSKANDHAAKEFMRNGGLKDSFPTLFPIVTSDGHSFEEIGTSYMDMVMPFEYESMNTSKKVVGALSDGIRSSSILSLPDRKHLSPLGGVKHTLELATILTNAKLASLLPPSLAGPYKYLDEKMRRPGYNSTPQIH